MWEAPAVMPNIDPPLPEAIPPTIDEDEQNVGKQPFARELCDKLLRLDNQKWICNKWAPLKESCMYV